MEWSYTLYSTLDSTLHSQSVPQSRTSTHIQITPPLRSGVHMSMSCCTVALGCAMIMRCCAVPPQASAL